MARPKIARASNGGKVRARDPEVAQETAVRMLEKGLDLADPVAPGFRKNVQREAEREAQRWSALADDQGGVISREQVEGGVEDLLDAIKGDASLERRAKPMSIHTQEALDVALHEHVVGVLSDWTKRPWTEGCTAELREHVGNPGGEWPLTVGGEEGFILALREAVVVEVDEHGALGGAGDAPPSALAAVSFLCGDRVRIFPAEFEEGVTPGEVLDRIAKGLVHHRKNSGVHAAKPATPKRVRRPKKKV